MIYVLSELVAEAVRYLRKHPRASITAGLVGGLIGLRVMWLLVWWFLLAPSPCYALNGHVTCDGVPLADGNIAFEPIGTSSVASRTAHVRDGTFLLDRANGVVRGVEYVVRVEGFRKTGVTYPGAEPGEFSEEMEQYVLPAFNRESS